MSQPGEGGRGRGDGSDQGQGGGGRGRGSGGYGQQARNRSRAVPAHGPPPKVAFTGALGGGSKLVALKKPAPAPASVPSHLNPKPVSSSQAPQANGPAAMPQQTAAPRPAWGKPASPPQQGAPVPESQGTSQKSAVRGQEFPSLGAEPSTAPTGGSASLPNGVLDNKPAATAAGSMDESRQASGPLDRSQHIGSSAGGHEHELQPQRQGSGQQGPDPSSRREDRGSSQGGHDGRGSFQGDYHDDRRGSQGGYHDDRGNFQGSRDDRGYPQSVREDRRDGNRRGDRRDRNGKEGRKDRGGGFTGNRADEEDSWRRSGPPPAGRRSRGRDQGEGGHRSQDQRGRQGQVGQLDRQQQQQGHQGPLQEPNELQARSEVVEEAPQSSGAQADEANSTPEPTLSAPQAAEGSPAGEAGGTGEAAADDDGGFIEARRPKRAARHDRQAAFIQSTARPGDRPLHHSGQQGGGRGRGARLPAQPVRPQGNNQGQRPQQRLPSQSATPRQEPSAQPPRGAPPTRQKNPPVVVPSAQWPERPEQPVQSAPPRPVWGKIPSSVLQPPSQRPQMSPRAPPLPFGDIGPAGVLPGLQQPPSPQSSGQTPLRLSPRQTEQAPSDPATQQQSGSAQPTPSQSVTHDDTRASPVHVPQSNTRPSPAASVNEAPVAETSAPAEESVPESSSAEASATQQSHAHAHARQQPDPYQPDRVTGPSTAPTPAACGGAGALRDRPQDPAESQPSSSLPSIGPSSASPPMALTTVASEAGSSKADAEAPLAQERSQAVASPTQTTQQQDTTQVANPAEDEKVQEPKQMPQAGPSTPAQPASVWGQKPAWGQKSFKDVVATAPTRPAMSAQTRRPARVSGQDSPRSQSSQGAPHGSTHRESGRPAKRVEPARRDSRDSSLSSVRSRGLDSRPPQSPKAHESRRSAAPASPVPVSKLPPPEIAGSDETGVAAPSAATNVDISATSTSQAASEAAEMSVTKDVPAEFETPSVEHSEAVVPESTPVPDHEPPGLQAAIETKATPPDSEAPQEAAVSQEDFPSLPGPKPAAGASQFPATNLSDKTKAALTDLLENVGQAVLASKLRLQPRGLVNTGNLCFMNSVLQALMASSPFCSFLRTLHTAQPALSPKEVPTLHAFANLAAAFQPAKPGSGAEDATQAAAASPESAQGPKAAQAASNGQLPKLASKSTPQALLGGKPLLPEMMFPTVNKFNPRNVPVHPGLEVAISMAERLKGKRVAQREQEDAQEFLSFLLDSAHEEMIRLRSAYSQALSLADESSSKAAPDDDGGGWTKQKKGNRRATTQETGGKGCSTLVRDLCGGQFVSQVRAAGAPQSDTTQPFTLLTLDILADGVATISDAISLYTKSNDLQDYKLKKDGPEVKATKTMQLLSLPKMLIVHLSRFAYDAKTRRNTKVSKPVRFESRLALRGSWMAAECPHKKRNPQYELMATVTHVGTTSNSGHYTANVKQANGKWLHFDDANVSGVSGAQVLDETAYLLIYELVA